MSRNLRMLALHTRQAGAMEDPSLYPRVSWANTLQRDASVGTRIAPEGPLPVDRHCSLAADVKKNSPSADLMPTTAELTEEIRETALQVGSAQERSDDRDFVAATHVAVEKVSQRYRDLLASLADKEKMEVERTIGRRLLDLKRSAQLLPRIGTIGSSTPDRQVSGPSEVGERRITGVHWTTPTRGAPSAHLSVGSDIEGWCGPCAAVTTHSVVAMVGTLPKQVTCQTCGGRHGFRTTPARKTSAPGEQQAPSAPRESDAARRAEQKAEELRALGREVHAAAEVKPFDPKGRYRSGEIISHPAFGRGKVETVLRSSMLVRFANGGMKSVILQ